jgi:chromosome partitioning protein
MGKSKSSCIIALFNQSGGVSKSTLTMNLGFHLHQLKHRVLLVDMDPQGSLTLFMGLEPSELTTTIYDSVIGEQPLAITSIRESLDLVPANIKLSGAELELVMADMRDVRLKEALATVKDQYDFILIDCPPSLGLLSYVSLVAANYVLVPIQTQYKAFCGTELLLSTVARVKNRANRQLNIAGFVPTMYAKGNSQDARALKAIQEQMTQFGTVFPAISRSTAFADAAESHQPLVEYNSKHPAISVLKKIAKSLEELR